MDRHRAKVEQHLRNMKDAADDADEDKFSFKDAFIPLTTCVICGGIFGFAAGKSKVFETSVIQDQMSMQRFIMVKVFLAAVSSSMFVFSFLSMIPATSDKFLKARRSYVRSFVEKGFLTSLLGGVILGAGMTISGACPGMVLVQVGARVTSAVVTLAGCLCGAVVYGALEPYFTHRLKPKQPYMQNFLHQIQGAPYFTVSLPMAAVVAMVVFGLELVVPWESELQIADTLTSWPPFLSGTLIGLLQIPLVIFLHDTLGGSSGYCTVMSQVLGRKIQYLAKFRSGLANWWQVVFMASAIGGAYLASSNQISPPGVSASAGFFGGLVMVFGARLAAGCTSGHGLSGMGLLSLHSLACVPAMFAGGMLTKVILDVVDTGQ